MFRVGINFLQELENGRSSGADGGIMQLNFLQAFISLGVVFKLGLVLFAYQRHMKEPASSHYLHHIQDSLICLW